MKTTHKLLRACAPLLPKTLKGAVRSAVSLREYDQAMEEAANPFRDLGEAHYPGSPYRMAIVRNTVHNHRFFIGACRDLQVSYATVDLLADDWIAQFCAGKFSAVLVWPDTSTSVLKQVFDYRLRILESDMGFVVCPNWLECWLTEHKPRLRDWLDAHGLPHARTWVFHDLDQALAFAKGATLPIVVKTATGAGATGVRIVRARGELEDLVRQSFGRGLRPRRFDARDRQRGFVYLQEYFPDVEEWRMVRIGDSYFGYRKEKGADGLHSASHKWSWLDPGKELLDLLKRVTDEGGFTSMNVDIFRTPDRRLFISELQTVFGCSTPAIYMKVNDVEGRYVRAHDQWVFEPGEYWANYMCNLRVQHLLARLGA